MHQGCHVLPGVHCCWVGVGSDRTLLDGTPYAPCLLHVALRVSSTITPLLHVACERGRPQHPVEKPLGGTQGLGLSGELPCENAGQPRGLAYYPECGGHEQ